MRPVTKTEIAELQRIHKEFRRIAIETTRLESDLEKILNRHLAANVNEAAPRIWAIEGMLKHTLERLQVSY